MDKKGDALREFSYPMSLIYVRESVAMPTPAEISYEFF